MPETIVSKVCRRCKEEKPVAEFYKRSGTNYYLTECKACMLERDRTRVRAPKTQALVPGEVLAQDYLKKAGIPTLPGKAISATDTDLLCFGAVRVEVKHASEGTGQKPDEFEFVTSITQQKRGLLAEVVMLICEYKDGHCTYHFLKPTHPAFYNQRTGKLKQGISFKPGRVYSHVKGRICITQQEMDAAQDATWLIDDALADARQKLRNGETLLFEMKRKDWRDKSA